MGEGREGRRGNEKPEAGSGSEKQGDTGREKRGMRRRMEGVKQRGRARRESWWGRWGRRREARNPRVLLNSTYRKLIVSPKPTTLSVFSVQ